jgi:2-polyprenyl-6-methoxyphenol hydroxylase-like FAD-dependent oxidoreductase
VRALVVGGGVGGLTAAIALRQSGFDVSVVERRTKDEGLHEGGGMTLWQNAMRALQMVDLAEPMQTGAAPLQEMWWRKPHGEPLAEWPVDQMNREFGLPVIGVSRAHIHEVLMGALADGSLRLGVECAGFEQDGSGVTARFANGEEERYDVLVGADGIYSKIRAQVLGESKPRYAGYVLTFGVVRLDHEMLTVNGYREWDGRGIRLLSFPIGDAQTHWSAIYRAKERSLDEDAASKAELLEMYKGWQEPVADMISGTEETALFHRYIYDREPVERWGEGNVTLLGDAAHPMTPNMGQGACMAIEDAVVLAKDLRDRDPSDVPATLRAWERKRSQRAAHFSKLARMIGRLGRWKNPILCAIRYRIQSRMVPGSSLKEQREALGYPL